MFLKIQTRKQSGLVFYFYALSACEYSIRMWECCVVTCINNLFTRNPTYISPRSNVFHLDVMRNGIKPIKRQNGYHPNHLHPRAQLFSFSFRLLACAQNSCCNPISAANYGIRRWNYKSSVGRIYCHSHMDAELMPSWANGLNALFNNVLTLYIWAACPYMLSVYFDKV